MGSEATVIRAPIDIGPEAIRTIEREVGDTTIEVVDDPYSDRLRCDHPEADAPHKLAQLLKKTSRELGRDRVVALVDSDTANALEERGFETEGVIPGFYHGEDDCEVMGWADNDDRMRLAAPRKAVRTHTILEAKRHQPRPHVATPTERATVDDAAELADLLGETFAEYPTPSSDPGYIAKELENGTPFRVVREGDDIAACASADLVTEARTAELTDCATRPDSRGNGYMQAILRDLMDDLRDLRFPTAFTLARAAIPGVNIAFQRLGFEYRGRMAKSCRIGDGLEDMNIWSRHL